MLTTNTKLDVRPGGAPPFGRDSHQFTHTFRVDGDERIGLENPLGGIFADEPG